MLKKEIIKQAAVVIPIYKNELTKLEQISLQQVKNVLQKHDLFFAAPEGVIFNFDEEVRIERFPKEYFESVHTYNSLMLSKWFYKRFLEYEYILIYQLDAFVFDDKLACFCEQGYDYIGAPWLDGMYQYIDDKNCIWKVGNGGFSLRNVRKAIQLLEAEKDRLAGYKHNEDLFFATAKYDFFQVAPVEVAIKFAFERNVEQCFKMNNYRIPFGCHAWERYNLSFWKPYIEKYGYKIGSINKGDEDKRYKEVYEHRMKVSYFWEKQYDKSKLKAILQSFFNENNKKYILFGAGFYGIELSKWIADIPLELECFCDNNEALWKEKVNGYRVIGKQDLLPYRGQVNIIIASLQAADMIMQQLNILGFVYKKDFVTLSDVMGQFENWLEF